MPISVAVDTGAPARDERSRAPTTDGLLVPIDDVMDLLEPFPRRIVRLIYLEGLSLDKAARALAVERVVVATSLAATFRRIARVVEERGARGRPSSW